MRSEAPTPNLIVNTSLRLREGPGTPYSQIGTLRKGEEYYVIGQYDDCSWLQVSDLSEINGWLRSDKSSIEVQIACSDIPPGIFRPPTGIIMPVQGTRGWSQIKIDNGTNYDAVLILTNLDSQPIVSAYLRIGDTFTISKVFDGIYYLYFSTGTDWNGKEFTNNSSYHRFVNNLNFETEGAKGYSNIYTYTIWTVTLAPGDSAGSTLSIPPDEFPAPEE